VIVGEALAPVGAVVGGVYVTAKADGAVNVPQAGEQFVPPAAKVHETPLLAGSLETFAIKVTDGSPDFTDANLFVMVTPMVGKMLKLKT
jgi:hypothetical protein